MIPLLAKMVSIVTQYTVTRNTLLKPLTTVMLIFEQSDHFRKKNNALLFHEFYTVMNLVQQFSCFLLFVAIPSFDVTRSCVHINAQVYDIRLLL